MDSNGSSMHSISIPDGNKALQMRRECIKMEATTPRSTSTFTVVAMVLVSNRTIFNLVVAKKYRLKKKGINILKLATTNDQNIKFEYTIHEPKNNPGVVTFYKKAIERYGCNLR